MCPRRARLDIGAVHVPRPAEVYADLIREKILSGELAIGTQLPPERILVEESGLTRAAVREALQRLQQQGLVTTKPGRGGGSVVSRPDASMFMSSVDLQLQGWAPGTQMLFESRQVIEPWCAYFAAERRTEADLRTLRAIEQRAAAATAELETFIECKVRWHIAVATASHNDLLSTFMEAVSRAILRQTGNDAHRDPAAMSRSLAAHRAVTDAIVARDAAEAFRLMTQHTRTPPMIELAEGEAEFSPRPERRHA
ncbi:FadR/GntR family transcriptional regulator [Nocardia harenae]|uniref:FadR/GntR family transcriptional regulator n=1 Tax=Nocardia harenae TaxID=358707 RepID=UPI00083147BE|nr:FadR/GntR family transcriptional regulator [Nocardia harenae]